MRGLWRGSIKSIWIGFRRVLGTLWFLRPIAVTFSRDLQHDDHDRFSIKTSKFIVFQKSVTRFVRRFSAVPDCVTRFVCRISVVLRLCYQVCAQIFSCPRLCYQVCAQNFSCPQIVLPRMINSLYQKVRRNLVQIGLDDYVRKSSQKCGHENHEKSMIWVLKKYPHFASLVASIKFCFIKLSMVHSDQKTLFSRRVDYQRQIGDLG